MNKGKAYGVSVGPGDGMLITLEAINTIKMADIVFLPSAPKEDCKAYIIIKQSIPEIDDMDLRCETFTMSRDSNVMSDRHDEIFRNICPLLDEGKNIVFLALGEVSLYSTYLYIHDRLVRAGYSSSLISGISSVQAISAKLGIGMALGSTELHIFPDTDNIETKLKYNGTRVFMKPKGDMSLIVSKIKDYVKTHDGVIACGISNCGMEGEKIARSVDELDILSGYFTVIFVCLEKA